MQETLTNKRILIISNEPWGKQWFIKHHWANELSKKNTVFFLNPAGSFSLLNFNINQTLISKSLTSINYRNAIPFSGRYLLFNFLHELFFSLCLNFKLKHPIDLVISFDPFRPFLPKFITNESIYYAADDYKTFLEKIIIKKSKIVIAVSEVLMKKLNAKHTIKHGVPDQYYTFLPYKNSDDISLFCGASFSDRIDYELLTKIARKYINNNLILVGPDQTHESKNHFINLMNLPNVKYLGEIDFYDYMDEIDKARICLVPYLMNQQGNMLNSLKIIQYLSKGKPIVSSFFKDYEKYVEEQPDLMYMTKDKKTFLSLIDKAILEDYSDETFYANRFKFASNFFYSEQLKQLEAIIKEVSK